MKPPEVNHRFCVAPMMDWTDRHDRMFLRQFTRRAMLYTEMIAAAALRHGDAEGLLAHDPYEHPLGLQLGGSDPAELAAGARLGFKAGYQEINLNVGCPSDRVQAGRFGACLMAEPGLVADCIAAMAAATPLPVTVKCRIGIDDDDSEAFLFRFIEQAAAGGCRTFIIHARKAVLSGLSPKQNREIPPLNYGRVFAVKARFPELEIVINGGITGLAQAKELLASVDGVMLGREAYQNPYLLHQVDGEIFAEGQTEAAGGRSRRDYLEGFLPYVEREVAQGTPLHHITRHTLGLFRGVEGGRRYRRHLSERACRPDAGVSVLEEAMGFVA